MQQSGFAPGPLPELIPLLKKWIYVNKEYLRRCEGRDAAWWYLERASLSTVAAAAWLADGIALEEYTTSKTQLPAKSNVEVSHRCRCDLFFSLKRHDRPGQNHDFISEAKIIWPSLASKNLHSQISRGVETVRRDVRRTQNDGHSRRLGVLLISPSMSETAAERWEEHAKNFVMVLRHQQGAAVAWVFSSDPWRLWTPKSREYHPGTAVLFSPLRRS
jgi:hypothetical protein